MLSNVAVCCCLAGSKEVDGGEVQDWQEQMVLHKAQVLDCGGADVIVML